MTSPRTPRTSTAATGTVAGPTTNDTEDVEGTILVQDTATSDPRRVKVATVANTRYRDGYAPGDTAKKTLFQRFGDDKVVTSADAGKVDGFRGTVIVQEGDTVSAGAARLLAPQ